MILGAFTYVQKRLTDVNAKLHAHVAAIETDMAQLHEAREHALQHISDNQAVLTRLTLADPKEGSSQ